MYLKKFLLVYGYEVLDFSSLPIVCVCACTADKDCKFIVEQCISGTCRPDLSMILCRQRVKVVEMHIVFETSLFLDMVLFIQGWLCEKQCETQQDCNLGNA